MKVKLNTWVYLAVGLCLTSCLGIKTRGPYSLDEILSAEVPLPLYATDPNTDDRYSQLGVTYYYSDLGDDVVLNIYFTSTTEEGETARVAKMMICSACSLIGPPDEATGRQVPLSWAQEGSASTCRVLSNTTRNDRISGDDYKSCLFWFDEALFHYKLYTVWPEDELEGFLLSLQRVDGASEP